MYDIYIIGGCGRVGLPLAIAFADKGKRVAICDINKRAVEKVSKGQMPFMERDAGQKLKKLINKKLFIVPGLETISKSKFIIITIGTPVDKYQNPKFDIMKKLLGDIERYLKDGQILILRSTVYPGSTEYIHRYLKGMNKKVDITFCPERIAGGEALKELASFPQIVSGFNKESMDKVSSLFKLLTDDIIQTKPLAAELSKLFTNAYRYVHFAIVNQFYMIAEEFGLDFYDIYKMMVSKYPRMKNFPMAGFTAGPCLFKDTRQLVAFNNNNFSLGHSAMLVNEGMPNFIVRKLKKKFDLHKKKVGIFGMAFKADSDDKRNSLSYKLRKILKTEAKEVYCTDPYINEKWFVPLAKAIKESDIIIIGAPHKKYKNLIFPKNKVIVDIWDMYGDIKRTL